MNRSNEHIARLEKLLLDAERKENKNNFLLGAANAIFFISISVLIISLAESLAGFSVTVRTILFALLLILFFAIPVKFILIEFWLKRYKYLPEDHIKMAGKAMNLNAGIESDLQNTLEIYYADYPGASKELIYQAVKKAADRYGDRNIAQAVALGKRKNRVNFYLAATLLAMLILSLSSSLGSAFGRVINYNRDYSSEAKYHFTIVPGNALVTKGDDVHIKISVDDSGLNKLKLFLMQDDETEYRSKELSRDETGTFKYQAVNVRNSFTYYAAAENVKSELYKITAVSRPVVKGIEVNIIPPAYSGMKPETQADNGNITALLGSKVRIVLRSSKELLKAETIFDDSSKVILKVNGDKAAGEFAVKKEGTYVFSITDRDGNSNLNPVRYSIKIIPDEAPSIAQLSPDENISPGLTGKLNIIASVKDDFGFSKLELKYSVAGRKEDGSGTIKIPLKPELKEGNVYYIWDISGLALRGGETAEYFLEIFDNDNISGPKSAKSTVHKITVPTLDYLLDKASEKEESIRDDMKDILDEASNLKKELEKVSSEIKKERKELGWEEKNSISNNVEKFEKLLEKVEKTDAKFSELNKNISEEKLYSKETIEKLEELQSLFKELNSDEIKQALKKLQDALKDMLRDNARQALDKLQADEESFRKSLERTINLFKLVKVEQKLDEVIKRLENLKAEADRIKGEILKNEAAGNEAAEKLAGEQAGMTEEIKNLQAALKQTQDLMKDIPDMPVNEMKSLVNEFQNQNNGSNSENSRKDISSGKLGSASGRLEQMSSNFSSLGSKMEQMKKNLLQKNRMKSVSAMMKEMNNLLSLSKDQENLRKEMENLLYNPEKMKEKLKPQDDLRNNLLKSMKNLGDLSQTEIGITPEIGSALGKALNGMQQAVSSLEAGGGNPMGSQKNAMEGLNRSAELLKGSINSLMNGGASGGMSSFMQQLQRMIKQQSDLNSLTKQLNGQDIAGMQRLARQQDLIRKSIEKLNREAAESGKSKTVAGNLEKTIEEMKSIVRSMNENRPLRDIVNKQERILSRMLDSQLSMNERDFEKNRESASGADFNRTSPGQLNLKEKNLNNTENELLNMEKEGYSKDYKSLIRRYFELLEKRIKK